MPKFRAVTHAPKRTPRASCVCAGIPRTGAEPPIEALRAMPSTRLPPCAHFDIGSGREALDRQFAGHPRRWSAASKSYRTPINASAPPPHRIVRGIAELGGPPRTYRPALRPSTGAPASGLQSALTMQTNGTLPALNQAAFFQPCKPDRRYSAWRLCVLLEDSRERRRGARGNKGNPAKGFGPIRLASLSIIDPARPSPPRRIERPGVDCHWEKSAAFHAGASESQGSPARARSPPAMRGAPSEPPPMS